MELFGCSGVQKSKGEEKNLAKKKKKFHYFSRPRKFSSGKYIICTLKNTTGFLPRYSTKAKLKPDQGLQLHMCGPSALIPAPMFRDPFASICLDTHSQWTRCFLKAPSDQVTDCLRSGEVLSLLQRHRPSEKRDGGRDGG